MTDTTEEKNPLDKLEDETVQKIDFIIRGLELGKFDETAKKVEFLGKLSGDNAPKYIAKLLSRITELENKVISQGMEMSNLTFKVTQLETDKANMEVKIISLETNMKTVAKAIRQLFEPRPLTDSYDMSEINTFCNNNDAARY